MFIFLLIIQTEFVEGDIEYVKKSLKETVVPEVSVYCTGLHPGFWARGGKLGIRKI